MHFFKNLPIDVYVRLMQKYGCLIGNSSSGIREGAFLGTPVVNIGSRQDMRERGENVIDVGYNSQSIADAIDKQIQHGSFGHQPIYGDGTAGTQIANILSSFSSIEVQKKITF